MTHLLGWLPLGEFQGLEYLDADSYPALFTQHPAYL